MSEKSPAPKREAVVAANARVHSALVDHYEASEPHFRPENVAKVRRRIEALASAAPETQRLLDLGCGTGFIIGIAKDLFLEVHGVDVTPAMLERVDRSSGNVVLHQGIVEELPYPDGHFDAVTAYSFLDHLTDHVVALREAARVLRPGGRLYIDLVPNRNFWSAIYGASTSTGRPYGSIVEREIDELVNHERKLEEAFGVSPEDWRLAEPAKSGGRGFLPEELLADLQSVGFDVVIEHEWFLGQARVHHDGSPQLADKVDAHLRSLLPISRHLFKYLVVTGARQ